MIRLSVISLFLVFLLNSCYKTDPEVLELLKQIQSQNEALKTQVASMQKSTDSIRTSLIALGTTSAAQSKKLDSIKNELTIVVSQINILSTQLQTSNVNIADIQAKIIALQATCDQLYKLLSACCSTLSTINDGLVAYYPFTGNANDESGNGNNGTVSGATLTTDKSGTVNSAYNFDGLSKITVPHSSSLNIGTEFTISIWLKYTTLKNSINYILQKGSGGGCLVNGYYFAFDNNTGSLPTHIKSFSYGPDNNCAAIGDSSYLDTNWHHIAIVYNPTKLDNQIYFDGVKMSSTSKWNACPSCLIVNTDTPLIIGGYFATAGGYNWNGKLDEIRMYKRALLKSEIVYLATH